MVSVWAACYYHISDVHVGIVFKTTPVTEVYLVFPSTIPVQEVLGVRWCSSLSTKEACFLVPFSFLLLFSLR